MAVQLYNSLTRKIEPFVPRADNAVDMFVCGPTVYDSIHLGNARAFTIFDVVAKWLRHSGYTVNYIQNITDIDDKIITRAGEHGTDPLAYAHEYDEKFRADMLSLGNDAVSQFARATDHIPQVIAQVKQLIATDHVYLIENDGWYFDLTTFPDYGKLSGRTGVTAEDSVSRIDDNEKKRNTGDFCVWKLSKPGEPVWEDDQLGAGRPGWHIEDTAITDHYFGPQYDLHGGGMDLKFPHHEAEIAQQESASGKVPFVRYWMHSGFLETKSKKMSKSLGNFMTLNNALKVHKPEVLRFYFLSNHYRAPLDFSDTALNAAQAAVERIGNVRARLFFAETSNALPATVPDAYVKTALAETMSKITEAMDTDFNTAMAFGAIFEFAKKINQSLTDGLVSVTDAQSIDDFFMFISRTFGIIASGGTALPDEVEKLIAEREVAREEKDFAASDTLRDELLKKGWGVDDTPYGPLVKKKE